MVCASFLQRTHRRLYGDRLFSAVARESGLGIDSFHGRVPEVLPEVFWLVAELLQVLRMLLLFTEPQL